VTQAQRKQQPVQLAPNQIYLKRPGECHPVQTLVEGYNDWSYFEWEYTHTIALSYKGRYVTALYPCATGGWTDGHLNRPHSSWPITIPSQYTSFADAVQVYEQAPQELLATYERWNKADGLTAWCVRQSFRPTRLHLTLELPPEERTRLVRLAQFDGRTLEEFALESLYKHLSAVEERFLSHQQWEQRQHVATAESEAREEASA